MQVGIVVFNSDATLKLNKLARDFQIVRNKIKKAKVKNSKYYAEKA